MGLFRAEDQVFEAMLDGWRAQQLALERRRRSFAPPADWCPAPRSTPTSTCGGGRPTTWMSSWLIASEAPYSWPMARAGQELVNTPRFPPDVIGVSAMEQGVFEPAEVWERAIRDAIERQGFRTKSRLFHGRGAAAGGPELLMIFEMLRHVAEAGGALALFVQVEQMVRKRRRRRQDAQAVGEDRNSYLHVQLSHGRPEDTTTPPPLTTRDLVRVLPAVREVLEERGNYLIDLEGGTRAGGSLCVSFLEPHDLRGRAFRRLIRLTEQAQDRAENITASGVQLRAFFWQDPWTARRERS